MYDKFKCIIKDFEISPDPALDVESLPFNPRSKEISGLKKAVELTINGETKLCKKAYSNHGTANITYYKAGDDPRLKIEFNPSKTGKYSNYETADHIQLKETIKKIQGEMIDIGISCNLENADIHRLDLTRNIDTDYEPKHYIKILSDLPKTTIPQKALYPTGVMMGNTQRNVIAYDKIEEMLKNHIPIDDYNLNKNSNILRIENQLLNKRVVNDALKAEWKLKGFTSPDLFQHCKEVYKSELKAKIFKTKVNKIEAEAKTAGLDQFYKYFHILVNNYRHTPGRALPMVLQQLAADILNSFDTQDILKKIDPILEEYYKTDGAKRAIKSRLKNSIIKAQQLSFNLKKIEVFPGTTKKKLYHEIYKKALKSA